LPLRAVTIHDSRAVLMKRVYRAEQVGSLLRPPDLLETRQAFAEGRVPIDALRSAEDRAIADALHRQREIGIDILSDGEMRRGSWLTDMADAVDGFVEDRVLLEWKGPGGTVEATTARVAGATLRKTRPLTSHEVPFLVRNAEAPFKVTLPAPSNFIFTSFKAGVTDRVYASRAALLDDLVQIVRDEIRWLIEQGVAYIQFDAPFYSHYVDPQQRAKFRLAGIDPELELERAIAGDNAALLACAGRDVVSALHVCRGNSRSRWYMEGAYDLIAEKLFGMLDVDTFLLEYDDERSGGFEPLRLVPPGKNVVLGLVTTKQPSLESEDGLRRRIDEAAAYVPLENLALSPQCGFASVASGNLLTLDQQWRKLELVVTTARQVWGSA
jgi:5-methyltetrahydropteroyltriglutamate--homocysteine methyltransferase